MELDYEIFDNNFAILLTQLFSSELFDRLDRLIKSPPAKSVVRYLDYDPFYATGAIKDDSIKRKVRKRTKKFTKIYKLSTIIKSESFYRWKMRPQKGDKFRWLL